MQSDPYGQHPALPGPPAPRPALGRRLVALGGWVCLIASVGLWGVLRFSDLWSPATILMFAPLHLLTLLPAALLVAALVFRRRALRTLVPALLITAGPVAGFSFPWHRASPNTPAGPRLRVLTCNMHYAKLPAGPLDRLIDETRPDVVALQEWRDSNQSASLAEAGWHVHRVPGLFLASRYPVRRFDRLGTKSTGPAGSAARYEVTTPTGTITVFSVHFATPRDGLSEVTRASADGLNELAENSERRWEQSRNLAAAAEETSGPLLLVGDFNTPPHSAIFRRVWDEYENAFGSAGWGWGHTFATRVAAVRIDHILAGGGGRALKCWVGPHVGSPHRPVLADIAWPLP